MTTENKKTLTVKELAKFEQVQPMWKIVLSQFLEHKMAVVGSVIITLFLFIALLAPGIKYVTGLDPERQNPMKRFEKPLSVVSLTENQKEEHLLKFAEDDSEAARQLEVLLAPLGIQKLTQLAQMETLDALSKIQEIKSSENIGSITQLTKIVKNFDTLHLFGTDELGRDVFIRLVYGTRVSMGIGILVAIASTIIGLLIGSFSGYYGGLIDTTLMRATDSLLSLPVVPVQIVIASVDMNKLPLFKEWIGGENESVIKLVFILLLFSWMGTARLVRGSILSIREREFILASKTLGARDTTIIFRHMFPNVVAPLLVSVTLGVGESILFEAALSFLGLGIQPPTPSWGNMLMNAQDLMYQAPFLAILPGLLILSTTISFNYVGDGLQDAVDPKAIRR